MNNCRFAFGRSEVMKNHIKIRSEDNLTAIKYIHILRTVQWSWIVPFILPACTITEVQMIHLFQNRYFRPLWASYGVYFRKQRRVTKLFQNGPLMQYLHDSVFSFKNRLKLNLRCRVVQSSKSCKKKAEYLLRGVVCQLFVKMSAATISRSSGGAAHLNRGKTESNLSVPP